MTVHTPLVKKRATNYKVKLYIKIHDSNTPFSLTKNTLKIHDNKINVVMSLNLIL